MPGDAPNVNNKAVQQNTFDAIVVGSGISGGWAAKELCEKGLKTLVLERGRNVEHIKDYTGATKDPWELKHRGDTTWEDRQNSPVQSRIYAYDEVSKHFFVNDKENPYTQVKPFPWIRGYHVGGRSLTWGRQCFRLGELDFEAPKDGIGVEWPVTYKEIAPWYGYVESFAGISGSKDGIPHLPDGNFLPPMDFNCVEKDMVQKVKKIYGNERRLIIGRVANLTRQLDGRGPCQYRSKCHQGCPFGGYFSSNAATIPAARRTGNLTLRPNAIVMEVLYDKEKKRATGVRIMDAETMLTEEYYAKIIFLNASTINTAALLLNSVSDAFPQGMGNSSGQIGHNLMTHHLGVTASGRVEGYEDKYIYGRRANMTYVPRFRNIGPSSKRTDYTRGFAFQTYIGRGGWGSVPGEASIGAEFKERLTEPGGWSMTLDPFAEMLPYYRNHISINKEVKDKWGMATVNIDCELGDNEMAMRKDMLESGKEMLEALGVKNVSARDSGSRTGRGRVYSVHEMGTVRMGKDPKTSPLNGNNQLHEVSNVFVTDGSFMTTSACQNPSLTYMAFTARACDFAVKTFK